MNGRRLYGIVAEFDGPESLLAAARAAREAGYRRFEAYTPYPIKELDDVIKSWNLVPPMMLLGGLTGGFGAYLMEYLIAAKLYPINVGGRPLDSWPAFIPITFELTVLLSACAGFFGLLFLCGLPALFHPLMQLPDFARATDDRFFLCIEVRDRNFHPDEVTRLFERQHASGVWEIERP